MGNTLKFGSGNWAAKKDSILAYNDENANFKPLPFTTSRASTATRINKAGLIEKVENGIPRVDYLGNTKGHLLTEPQSTNKIQYSEAFGNSYWTKSGASIEGDLSTAGVEEVVNGDFASASDWAVTGNDATHIATFNGSTLRYQSDTTSPSLLVRNSALMVVGRFYQITVDIDTLTSGYVKTDLFGDSRIISPSSGVHTFYGYATSTSFYITRGTTNVDVVINSISVKEVKGFASPSSDTPLGAFKLVENSGTGQHRMSVAISSPSAIHTISAFFKPIGTNRKAYLDLGTVTGFFDFTTKVFTSATGVGSYEEVSDGWYKLSLTSNSAVTISAIYIGLAISNETYNGDGTSGVYIFGAQLEQKPYSTSYIPNYGESAGVTRLVDTCFNGGNDQVINSTEGTIYVEANLIDGYDNNNFLVTIFDNSNGSNNHLFIQRYLGNIQAKIRVGTTQSEITQLNTSFGNKKIAFTYKLNEFKMFVNGSQVGLTDTSGSVFSPNTLDKINVGSFYDKTLNFNSQIKDLKLYNTVLTDSELQALTTI